MCLWKRERTYLFLPFGTALVRQPHYAGGRCADGDHLQDARSQGCEDDAAVCESAPKESASFVSTRLRPTAFASYSIAQGLVRASTIFIPLTIGRNNSNKNKSHYLNIVT